jgi:hypothetical protein
MRGYCLGRRFFTESEKGDIHHLGSRPSKETKKRYVPLYPGFPFFLPWMNLAHFRLPSSSAQVSLSAFAP